jgi:hypothetical protein
MSSSVLSSHSSGVSISDVSPIIGGIIGPIEILGYPILPMNTLGGEDPPIFNVSIKDLTLSLEWYLTITGHLVFPHRNLVPLQSPHKLGDFCLLIDISFFWGIECFFLFRFYQITKIIKYIYLS